MTYFTFVFIKLPSCTCNTVSCRAEIYYILIEKFASNMDKVNKAIQKQRHLFKRIFLILQRNSRCNFSLY